METLAVGNVVVASFPFSDLKYFKKRPALIIGFSDFDDVILCQISSISDGKLKKITISDSSFECGSLAVTSYIRPDKLFTSDKKLLTKVIGALKPEVTYEVKNALKEVLEL